MNFNVRSPFDMADIETSDQTPFTSTVVNDAENDLPSSPTTFTPQRLIQLPLNGIKILFPSSIFLSFFISSVIPSLATHLIPLFFTGNIPDKFGLSVYSQFIFISIVLKVIQDGVGNSLFHFVGAHYKRNKELAISAFNLSLLVLLFSGITLTATMLLFTSQFVKLIDTPVEISETTKKFFFGSAFSYVPTLFTTAFTNYLFISTSEWIVISQVVTVLTSFLINFFTFGPQTISLHWSVNEFGIYTVVQSTVTMTVSFGFVLLEEQMGPVAFFKKTPGLQDLKTNFANFFSVSWGNFADSIVRNFFYFSITLKFVNHLGVDESAAWNLFNNIVWGIILLPAFVVANYIRVRIGLNRTKSTIKEVLKESGVCMIAWIIVMIVVTSATWSKLSSFFSKTNEEVALISDRMFHDMGWVFVIYAFNNAVHSFLLATGQAKYIFYQSLAANLIVYLLPWMMYLFGVLTPTYWLIIGLYIAGMMTSCCLTTYFGVIVWESIPNA